MTTPCQPPNNGSKKSSKTKEALPYGTMQGPATLAPGDTVGICWRPMGANPFTPNPSKYHCAQSATAVPYPGDKSEGALSCKDLLDGLMPALGGQKRLRETVKLIEANVDPKDVAGGISLGPTDDCDHTTFYSNYITTDSAGKHWVFIDVQLEKK